MTQPYERSSTLSKKQIMLNNFLGGIFWAFGATVGLAVIFMVLSFVAKNADLVPIVGSFVSDVVDFVMNNNPNL